MRGTLAVRGPGRMAVARDAQAGGPGIDILPRPHRAHVDDAHPRASLASPSDVPPAT